MAIFRLEKPVADGSACVTVLSPKSTLKAEQQTITPTEEKPQETNNPAATADEKATQTILMEGPLSAIYTKALNLVFANKQLIEVSQESSSSDHPELAKNALASNLSEEKKLGIDDPHLYIYVTDSAHIDAAPSPEIFNQLHVALDKRTYDAVAVIETGVRLSKKQVILECFLVEQGVKVVHTRAAGLELIQKQFKNRGWV